MKIGILGAMSVETRRIISEMTDLETQTLCNMEFSSGLWQGHPVVVATCGIGKVAAAMGAALMIQAYRPDVLINTGVAGGVGPGLKVLDVVIATDVVQHDMDVSSLGDPKGQIPGLNLIRIPCDMGALRANVQAQVAARDNLRLGVIASGDQFIADPAKAREIRAAFGAEAVDMESGSIGQVCYMAGVPCCVIRAISDSADGMEYTAFVDQAADDSVALLAAILQGIS